MYTLKASDIILPHRKAGSHKGDNGRCLIIGGSEKYVGAPFLAGIAALRSGCDYVTIASPEKVAWTINPMSPDLITYKVKGKSFKLKDVDELIILAKKFDVVVIGNGCGDDSDMFIRKFIEMRKTHMVIDADAIRSVDLSLIKNSIITPHSAELELLASKNSINLSDRKQILESLQKRIGSNVILSKGQRDIIVGKKTYYNNTGNSAMTKAGTGDVLAGLCAGLYSQGLTATDAACSAAYINGLAGEILYKVQGNGLLASELADTIPDAIRKIEK